MEQTTITLAGREFALSIRRHRLARRISLRLSPARDSLMMTLPRRTSIDAGLAFARKQEHWVLTHVAQDNSIAFTNGAVIPLLGVDYTITHQPGRGVTRKDDATQRLHVYGDSAFTARRVRDFCVNLARRECEIRAMEMASHIGKKVKVVKVREQRSRWGSCSAKGTLTFNWRLVFAPLSVFDYLIAHEVAHLAEMNHSDRFWQVTASLCPDYKKARLWLKRHGHDLHRFGAI